MRVPDPFSTYAGDWHQDVAHQAAIPDGVKQAIIAAAHQRFFEDVYLDLIANPESRKVFVTRAKVIGSLRRQLEERGFIEVESPMMQPIYGGA